MELYPLARNNNYIVIKNKGIYLATNYLYAKVKAPLLAASFHVHGMTSAYSIPAHILITDKTSIIKAETSIQSQELSVTFHSLTGSVSARIDTLAASLNARSPKPSDLAWITAVVDAEVCAAPKGFDRDSILKCIAQTRIDLGIKSQGTYEGIGLMCDGSSYFFLNPGGATITHDHVPSPYTSKMTVADKAFKTLPYGYNPYTPDTIAGDVQKLLHFVHIIPANIGIGATLLASVLHAPFSQVEFTTPVLVEGISGLGKSALLQALLHVATRYQGKLRDERPTFSGRPGDKKQGSTTFSIETSAKYLRGVPVLHSDVMQAGSDKITVGIGHSMWSIFFDNLITGVGRGRGTSNHGEGGTGFTGIMKWGYISDVETFHFRDHDDPSTFGRAQILHLDKAEKGDQPATGPNVIDFAMLTDYQSEPYANAMNNAMQGFIAWMLTPERLYSLVNDWTSLEKTFTVAGHSRSVVNAAKSQFTLQLFATYAYEVGAMSALDADQFLMDAHDGLAQCIIDQAEIVGMGNGSARADDPIVMYHKAFIRALRDHRLSLSSNKLEYRTDDETDVVIKSHSAPESPDGIDLRMLGWNYDEHLRRYVMDPHARVIGSLVSEINPLTHDETWSVIMHPKAHKALYEVLADIAQKEGDDLPHFKRMIDILQRDDLLQTNKTAQIWGESKSVHILNAKVLLDSDATPPAITDDSTSDDENDTSEEEYN